MANTVFDPRFYTGILRDLRHRQTRPSPVRYVIIDVSPNQIDQSDSEESPEEEEEEHTEAAFDSGQEHLQSDSDSRQERVQSDSDSGQEHLQSDFDSKEKHTQSNLETDEERDERSPVAFPVGEQIDFPIGSWNFADDEDEDDHHIVIKKDPSRLYDYFMIVLLSIIVRIVLGLFGLP